MKTMTKTQSQNNPAELVVIAKAAHLTGDRDLEREARRQLLEKHGIRISWARNKQERKK
jgi:hypothetical protein